MQFDREETANILKAHGIIPTRQRVEIGSILLAPGQHLSAPQLLDQVNQDSEAETAVPTSVPAAPARCHPCPQTAIGREYPVEAREVHTRFRDEGCQRTW